MRERIIAESEEAGRLIAEFGRSRAGEIAAAAQAVASAVSRGGKILLFGNGGSAADAQHIAAEFVNRLARDRAPIAALALTVDTSVLTSIANDFSFDRVFARQIEALGKRGDAAVAISTSGRSPNILQGIEAARAAGMVTVGLLGRDGGAAAGLVDYPLVVPHETTQRIQEVHILLGHLLSGLVEESLGLVQGSRP